MSTFSSGITVLLFAVSVSLLTACGGGGSSGQTQNTNTNSSSNNTNTNTNTTETANTIPIHTGEYTTWKSRVFPSQYSGQATSGSSQLSIMQDSVEIASITLSQAPEDLCPITNKASITAPGYVMAADEARGHYVLGCASSSARGIYIVDVNGSLLWQSPGTLSYDSCASTDIFVNGGVIYCIDIKNRMYAANYLQGEALALFYNFQLESSYTSGRKDLTTPLGSAEWFDQLLFLSDGRMILNIQEYTTDGGTTTICNGITPCYTVSSGAINSYGYYLHVLNSDGSVDMKLSHTEIKDWVNTQTGGDYVISKTRAIGLNSSGEFNLWLDSSSSSGSGSYLSVPPSDLSLLKQLITPAPVGDVTASPNALPSCTSSYDYSLNTGDPQVDTFCQGAWVYACAGSSTAVASYCQILSGYNTSYKSQCSYCAGF